MKRWEILHKQEQNALDQETIQAILLHNRNITTKKEIEDFFHPTLSGLKLATLGVDKKEITKALKLIEAVKKENKTIIIYGDYDVDGVSGTAILWESLYEQYKKTVPYIPHRVEEGYGLSKKGIDNVLEKFPDTALIITVDNGIAASEAVAYAKEKGLQVVITDHHTKGKTIPSADAVIHTTMLCGAGVAYALSREISNKEIEDRHLELVAIATVADCMPLKDINRAVVKFGLDYLKKTQRAGLLELFTEAKIDKNNIDVYHVGFMIAPRLNATGRLASAMDSLRLICTVDSMRAKILAQRLAGANRDRQDLTAESLVHAKSVAKIDEAQRIIVAADVLYNQGIIGLIASKLTESYYRPSIVISIGENGISKGSARSIKGVNIVDVLRSVESHLVQVGGHEMAAGFTIQTENIENFKQALDQIAADFVTDDHLQRVVQADVEITFDHINFALFQMLQKFAPFGIDNPEPSFVTKGAVIREVKKMGLDGKHVKLLLEQNGLFFEAVAFGYGALFKHEVGDKLDILYTIAFDTWKGKNKIVLRIKDLH